METRAGLARVSAYRYAIPSASMKTFNFACIIALFAGMAAVVAQTPPAQPPAGGAGGRGGRGGTRGPRFKIYPAEAINRGLPVYNSTCGYCHGERGKGGKAGPDLIASLVTLHDEDGVQIAQVCESSGAFEGRQDRCLGQLRSPISPPTCIRA